MTTRYLEPTDMSSLIGQTLGRYAIANLIGNGGMAEVYRATTPSSAATSQSR